MLFQLILLKPITSNFWCLFFHGKKKPLKELVKHFTLQFLLDTSTSKSSFLVVEDAFPSFETNALNFFLNSTLTVTIGIYFYVIPINSIENNSIHFTVLVFPWQKETIKGIGQTFYPSMLARYINFKVQLFGCQRRVSPLFY